MEKPEQQTVLQPVPSNNLGQESMGTLVNSIRQTWSEQRGSIEMPEAVHLGNPASSHTLGLQSMGTMPSSIYQQWTLQGMEKSVEESISSQQMPSLVGGAGNPEREKELLIRTGGHQRNTTLASSAMQVPQGETQDGISAVPRLTVSPRLDDEENVARKASIVSNVEKRSTNSNSLPQPVKVAKPAQNRDSLVNGSVSFASSIVPLVSSGSVNPFLHPHVQEEYIQYMREQQHYQQQQQQVFATSDGGIASSDEKEGNCLAPHPPVVEEPKGSHPVGSLQKKSISAADLSADKNNSSAVTSSNATKKEEANIEKQKLMTQVQQMGGLGYSMGSIGGQKPTMLHNGPVENWMGSFPGGHSMASVLNSMYASALGFSVVGPQETSSAASPASVKNAPAQLHEDRSRGPEKLNSSSHTMGSISMPRSVHVLTAESPNVSRTADESNLLAFSSAWPAMERRRSGQRSGRRSPSRSPGLLGFNPSASQWTNPHHNSFTNFVAQTFLDQYESYGCAFLDFYKHAVETFFLAANNHCGMTLGTPIVATSPTMEPGITGEAAKGFSSAGSTVQNEQRTNSFFLSNGEPNSEAQMRGELRSFGGASAEMQAQQLQKQNWMNNEEGGRTLEKHQKHQKRGSQHEKRYHRKSEKGRRHSRKSSTRKSRGHRRSTRKRNDSHASKDIRDRRRASSILSSSPSFSSDDADQQSDSDSLDGGSLEEDERTKDSSSSTLTSLKIFLEALQGHLQFISGEANAAMKTNGTSNQMLTLFVEQLRYDWWQHQQWMMMLMNAESEKLVVKHDEETEEDLEESAELTSSVTASDSVSESASPSGKPSPLHHLATDKRQTQRDPSRRNDVTPAYTFQGVSTAFPFHWLQKDPRQIFPMGIPPSLPFLSQPSIDTIRKKEEKNPFLPLIGPLPLQVDPLFNGKGIPQTSSRVSPSTSSLPNPSPLLSGDPTDSGVVPPAGHFPSVGSSSSHTFAQGTNKYVSEQQQQHHHQQQQQQKQQQQQNSVNEHSEHDRTAEMKRELLLLQQQQLLQQKMELLDTAVQLAKRKHPLHLKEQLPNHLVSTNAHQRVDDVSSVPSNLPWEGLPPISPSLPPPPVPAPYSVSYEPTASTDVPPTHYQVLPNNDYHYHHNEYQQNNSLGYEPVPHSHFPQTFPGSGNPFFCGHLYSSAEPPMQPPYPPYPPPPPAPPIVLPPIPSAPGGTYSYPQTGDPFCYGAEPSGLPYPPQPPSWNAGPTSIPDGRWSIPLSSIPQAPPIQPIPPTGADSNPGGWCHGMHDPNYVSSSPNTNVAYSHGPQNYEIWTNTNTTTMNGPQASHTPDSGTTNRSPSSKDTISNPVEPSPMRREQMEVPQTAQGRQHPVTPVNAKNIQRRPSPSSVGRSSASLEVSQREEHVYEGTHSGQSDSLSWEVPITPVSTGTRHSNVGNIKKKVVHRSTAERKAVPRQKYNPRPPEQARKINCVSSDVHRRHADHTVPQREFDEEGRVTNKRPHIHERFYRRPHPPPGEHFHSRNMRNDTDDDEEEDGDGDDDQFYYTNSEEEEEEEQNAIWMGTDEKRRKSDNERYNGKISRQVRRKKESSRQFHNGRRPFKNNYTETRLEGSYLQDDTY